MARPRPRLRTVVPRVRPSVGFMQMARTRPSPICCATSAVIVTSSPSIVTVNSMAWLISGRWPRGNSTSTTGPAIETTRPSLSSGASADVLASVTVIAVSSECSGGRAEQVGRTGVVDQEVLVTGRRLAERLGPPDDLHDLGRDGVLAGAVHDAPQAGDEVFRVVRGRLHRPLASGMLRRRRIEQCGKQTRLGVTREQPGEDDIRAGLELVGR